MKKQLHKQEPFFNELEELRKSKRLHQLILDNTHDLITIHKLADLTYEYANPATFKVLRYSQEELFAKSAMELIHPDDKDSFMATLKKNLPKGAGQDEFRYRNKDGSYVWLETTYAIISTESDHTCAIAISREITERKQAEAAMHRAHNELETKVGERTIQLNQINEQLHDKINELMHTEKALRASENHYRTIFENTGTATVIIDENLKISEANLKTGQLCGYTQQELIGLNPFKHFINPEQLKIVREKYRLRKLDQAKADYEIECIDKQGAIRNVVMNVADVPDSKNLVVSMRDVTEKRQAQSQLKASEERFRTLFEQAPLGININRKGRTLFVNQAYLTMFGYESSSELIGTPAINQVAPSAQEEIIDKTRWRGRREVLPGSHETLGQRKDGSNFSISVDVKNILLQDGAANVTFVADITSRKQAEAALERQVASQALLLEVSKDFNNIVNYNIDAMINITLQRMGEFDHNDRSYVFLSSEDGSTMSNTHEWCAEGISSEMVNLQDIPINMNPWWVEKLQTQEYLYVPRVADLPSAAQAEKEALQAQSIQSLLVVPLLLEGKIIGFMGCDSVTNEKIWPKENIIILESVAQTIVEALQRKRIANALAASESYYRTIFENTGAVTLIIEEDMSISMVNSEYEKVLGYKKGDLKGRKWTEAVSAGMVDKMIEYHRLRRIDPGSAPLQYESQMVDKKGKIREGLFIVDIIPGTKTSVVTFVDLTEYKRIDRALKAISAGNVAMIQAEKEYDLLESVCQRIVEVGGYSLAWVGYVQTGSEQKVQPVAYAGKDHGYLNKLNITLVDPKRGRGPTGTAIRTGQPVVSRNFKNDPSFKPWVKDALRRGLKSSMTIPLMADNQAFGVLGIFSDETDYFDTKEEELLTEMANNLAYAITSRRARDNCDRATRELAKSLEKMQRILMQAVTSLGTALDIRDPYTAGHQKGVGRLAAAIAQEMGFTEEQIEGITVAGNLHDIGKIKVPSEILTKPGKLSDIEFEMIKTHSQAGYEIIKEIEFPWPVAEIILQHHERMDGSGYPRKLAGEEILPEARVMAVADVVEAMASHRPYRPALGVDVALDEISSNRGKLYDDDVADACLRLFREKGFQLY